MRPEHLRFLRCPDTGSELELRADDVVDGRVRTGALIGGAGGKTTEYPIVDFVPRFVTSDNYAANFGLEWNLHARTQYDSYVGEPVTEARLFEYTKWPRDMGGEIILEAGSGAGRFTEHLLQAGATVISLDVSNAVDANYRSNGSHPNLLLVQADIYNMPVAQKAFDRVFCFGVLQHTPDPHASFHALVAALKPGGHLATDIYIKTVKTWLLNTRYWVRPLTRQMAPERLYRLCKAYIDFMWPLVRLVRRLPRSQAIIWRLLIADYSAVMPNASEATLREWAYLDTFDMLSPQFDQPQTPETFERWHRECGLDEVSIRRGGNGIVGTSRTPVTEEA